MTDPYFSPLRPDAASDTDVQAPGAAADGPGRLIRRARERAGLSLGDLATQTRLTVATLDALERDDFNTLRESVYVRGYYRKCAKVLQVSEQDLIAAYDRIAHPAASPSVPSKLLLVSGESERSFPAIGRSVIIAGLVIAGIAFVAVIVHRGLTRPQPAASPAPAVVLPDAGQPAPAAAGAPGGQSLAAPAAAPASPAAPAGSAAGPAAVQAPSPAGSSGADGDALVLDFRDRCWAEITDAAGKVLLSGMIRTGSHEVLSGKPPYTVFLGNAPKVDVSFGGKPVDLAGATRENDTARLQIPAN